MRKNPKLLIVLGALLLLAGFVLDMGAGGEAQATTEQEQACRTEMTSRGAGAEVAALAEKCSEANFAIATIASSVGSGMSAQDAAAAISQNNQAEVGGSTLSKFLMGLGIGLFLAGIISMVVRKRQG